MTLNVVPTRLVDENDTFPFRYFSLSSFMA